MSDTTSVADGVKAVRPGDGPMQPLMPGVGVAFKIDGRDTDGAVAIVEHRFEVAALVPPHIHHREDEFSIVLKARSVSGRRTPRSCSVPAAT